MKTVLITGAGSGLGRALSREFTGRGLRVVGVGRRSATLEETGAGLPEGRYSFQIADVSKADEVEALFATLADEDLLPDILFNNAAVYPHEDFLDTTPTSWMKSVDINLGGMVNCSWHALKIMTRTGRGRIINVASFAGNAPIAASSAYSVSKGACMVFTQSLVADFGDRFPGIVVNDWVPGALNTEMGIPEGAEPADAAKWGVSLALMDDPSLNGAMFERNTERVPARGLKGKIKDLVLMQPKRVPRTL